MVELLRPIAWFERNELVTGARVSLELQEMGLAGAADVLAIGPCPTITPTSPGTRTVIGRFVTTDARIIDLWIEGMTEPIGTTAIHPFWSLDRRDWIAAGSLKAGELLQALHGTATVAGVARRFGTETVYNIEVHKDHCYSVSERMLWVHNACTYPVIKHWPDYDLRFRKIDELRQNVHPENLTFLREIKPGGWQKVYLYGADGRQIHMFRHSSGEIFSPKWK